MANFEDSNPKQKVIVIILVIFILVTIGILVAWGVPAILMILYRELSYSLLSGMIGQGLLPRSIEWLDSFLVCLSALLLTNGWKFTWWLTKKIFSSNSEKDS